MKPPTLLKGLRFFKTREPRQFDFAARYYDEDKEKFQERVNKIKAEVEAEKNLSEDQKRELNSIRSGAYRRNEMRQQARSNIIRLLVILGMLIALLCVLAYGFLQIEA